MDKIDQAIIVNGLMDRIIHQLQNHINHLQDSIKEMLEVEEGMIKVMKGLQDRIYKLENPDE